MRLCLILYAAVVQIGTVAAGDTVTLRQSARLGPGPVTLAAIAELEGANAQAIANVVITEFPSGANGREITVAEVRAKLDEAGVHWGRVNVNGRSVVIRPARDASASLPLAMAPASIDTPTLREASPPLNQTLSAATLVAQPTLRGMIANLMTSQLRVAADALQLTFANTDAELLDLCANVAQFEVRPMSSCASDRVDLSVRVWGDGRVMQTRSISVWPQVRLATAVARNDLAKDQLIRDDDVIELEQWLSPCQANQRINRIAAIGRSPNRSIKAGESLREKHVRREMIVKKGDAAIVRCLIGGVSINVQAEAREDGAEGDAIEFRKRGERETFRATITGRGEAVMDLNRRQAATAADSAAGKQG